MSEDVFRNALAELSRVLDENGHLPILVGGWAVNQLGFARQTFDFDLMILEDDFDIVFSAFEKCGYHMLVKTSLYARFECQASAIKLIDVLFANQRTYEILAASKAKCNVLDSMFILPKAEHLIAMKLHAVKYGEGHRRTKDFIDIVELIKANDIDVNTVEFKDICFKHGDDAIYGRIIYEFN